MCPDQNGRSPGEKNGYLTGRLDKGYQMNNPKLRDTRNKGKDKNYTKMISAHSKSHKSTETHLARKTGEENTQNTEPENQPVDLVAKGLKVGLIADRWRWWEKSSAQQKVRCTCFLQLSSSFSFFCG